MYQFYFLVLNIHLDDYFSFHWAIRPKKFMNLGLIIFKKIGPTCYQSMVVLNNNYCLLYAIAKNSMTNYNTLQQHYTFA